MGKIWRALTGSNNFVSPEQYQNDSNAINAGNRAGENRLEETLRMVREGREEEVSSEDLTWAERHGGNAVRDARDSRDGGSRGR